MSKTPIFLKKTFIIFSFFVRFQFRLIHMTDLLILHVTKEKNLQKVFYTIVQSYFFSIFCDVWQPLSNWNGYNSKSIELRNFSKVIASCYRRPLQNEKEKRKIGAKLWRWDPSEYARAPLRTNNFFLINTSKTKTFSEVIASCYRRRLQNGSGCTCVKKKLWHRDPRTRAPITDELYLRKYLINHFLSYTLIILRWKLVFFPFFSCILQTKLLSF